jgi:hypothetical protein
VKCAGPSSPCTHEGTPAPFVRNNTAAKLIREIANLSVKNDQVEEAIDNWKFLNILCITSIFNFYIIGCLLVASPKDKLLALKSSDNID